MPGIDITVTQIYDKVVIGGLDYYPNNDSHREYGYLKVVRAGSGSGSLQFGDRILIDSLLEPVAFTEWLDSEEQYPSGYGNALFLGYTVVDPETYGNEHILVTIEPYYKPGEDDESKTTLSTGYFLQKGTLDAVESPFLGGFVDSDGKVNGLYVIEDVDAISSLGSSYPNHSFAIIHPRGFIGTSERYNAISGAGGNASNGSIGLFPCDLAGPVVTEHAIYAGNVADGPEWFAEGGVMQSSPSRKSLSSISKTDVPNEHLFYSAWQQSGMGSGMPITLRLTYSDIAGVSWGQESTENGITTVPLDDGTSVTFSDLHIVTTDIDKSVIIDANYTTGGESSAPYYMCCILETTRTKTTVTSGVLTAPFAKTFRAPVQDVINPYSDTKTYAEGDMCTYGEENTIYIHIAKMPSTGIPPTDILYWDPNPDLDREEEVSIRLTSIAGPLSYEETTGEGDDKKPVYLSKNLINTRALHRKPYSPLVGTGIVSTHDGSFPRGDGTVEWMFTRTRDAVATNYYGADPKNGQTMVYPILNLYKDIRSGVLSYDDSVRYKKGDVCSYQETENAEKQYYVYDATESGVGKPLTDSDYWIQVSVDSLMPGSLFTNSLESLLFENVASNVFPYIENEPGERTVSVTDTSSFEPLTNYTYVLTYAFSPSRSGTMLSDEYVCQTFDETTGITLFRYDIPTVHFGLSDNQYISSYVGYLGDADDQSVTQTIESGSGARYVYLILGETTGNTFEDGYSVEVPEENGVVGDINATILGHARVPAEYHQYAPTFSGTARLRFRTAEDTSATNDLYTANSPTAIAAVQNATTTVLPSVTWVPYTDEYTVRFFTIVATEDISSKLTTLLVGGKPFSFKRYQVLATATVPASMKDLECELITNFRLDFT